MAAMATTSTTGTSSTSATNTSSIDYLSYLGSLTSTPFNPNTVINALLSADQVPVTQLQSQITAIQADQTTYANIATDMSSLQSAEFSLTLQSVTQAKAASSSIAAVTAKAGPMTQAGTYSVVVNNVATSTTAASTAGLSMSLDSQAGTTPLSQLNLAGKPTGGAFSVVVDGKVQSVNVDLASALTDPNGALTALQSAIQSGIGDASATVTVGVSNNKVTIGITGSTSGTTHSISFGATGDSSNFLAMMNLSTVSGKTGTDGSLSLGSTSAVGVTSLTNPLNTAGLNTMPTGALDVNGAATTAGTFSINGTSFSWDTSKQSLNDIINSINGSNAGVTAQYDSVNDKLDIANKSTGQSAINLQDTGGTFLAAMSLAPGTTAAQTLGVNASITVNGGATITSASNTITNAVPGLSITAMTQTTAGSPAVVTVGPDVTGITKSVQTFVDALNKVMLDVGTTQVKDSSGNYGDLFGDPNLSGLSNQLLTTVLGRINGSGTYQSLQDIGINTGNVGSTPGTTNSVLFDTTKFAAALAAAPDQVAALFAGTKAVNGFTGIANVLNTFLDTENNVVNGPFAAEKTSTNAQVATMQSQVLAMQSRITSKQSMLVAEFSAMSTALNSLSAEQSILSGISGTSTTSSSSG
jgi:flagellar hook-associated protein 2